MQDSGTTSAAHSGGGVASFSARTDGGADGVVCFAGIDWWYHSRGHSECQILRRLARKQPVLWINSIGMRTPRPGGTELALVRYGRKIRSTLKGLRRDSSGMWVYSPLFLPRYSPRALAANGWALRQQIRVLLRLLGVRRPSVWVTVPTAAPAVLGLPWRRTVFNRSDDFSALPEVEGPLIRRLEHALLDRSDHVLYVNRGLFERERATVPGARLIDHGVDFEHFVGARPQPHETPPDPPSELRNLRRPVVGFYGGLNEYQIDLDLMIQCARRVPDGTLLLIGHRAMELDRLLREPNVRFLGPIPYADLPRYAAQFDVGSMPWQQNQWIEGCNPIKLKEYLALGFPVVSMHFPMLEPYRGLVRMARGREAFLTELDAALADRDAAAAAARRASVRESSWDALALSVGRWLGLGDESVATR